MIQPPVKTEKLEHELESASDKNVEAAASKDEHGEHGEHDKGLSIRTPFRGIINDFNRTIRTHWVKEMTLLNQKVIAVSFFLFFACITPAIAFGGLYEKLTDNWIGVVEMIAATAWCGIVYALFSGMPIFINGGTGPVLAFTGVLYQLSKSLDVPFLPFNAWVGIWIAFFLIISAIFNLNQHLRVVTRFTDEIFAGLISAIFIVSAGKGLYDYFASDHKSHNKMIEWLHGNKGIAFTATSPAAANAVDYDHFAVALLSLLTGVGTCTLAIVFRSLRNSPYFTKPVRDMFADFGTVLAIIIMALIDIYALPDIHTERLSAPDTFSPTQRCCTSSCKLRYPEDCDAQTLSDFVTSGKEPPRRDWLVDISDLNGKSWVAVFAAVPAILAFILVFLDDGITWHLVNKKDNKLTHGTAFHYDTIIIAICIVVNSFLGLPWLVAATVRSINHVQALSNKVTIVEGGHSRQVIDSVYQQRLSGLLIHVLVLICIFAMPLVKSIPMPVLYGIFLYMGLVALWTNQFWMRICMLIMEEAKFPPSLYTFGSTKVEKWQIHKFTAIQIVLFVILYAVKSIKSIAIAFPIIIALCVPVRMYVLPKYFTTEELNALDNASEERKEK